MNPEPPPIADPHSTASRDSKMTLKSLVYLLLSLPFLAADVVLILNAIYILNHTPPDTDVNGYVFMSVAFVVFSFLGFLFVRRSIRIWKYGR